MRTYEVRLAPAGTDGEPVETTLLADFLTAVQTLFYRVTREAADRAALGRTARTLERTSLVRLYWGTPGTVLLAVGDPATLEIDPLADRVDDALARLLAGMASNSRPAAVTNPVADAVDALVRAMTFVAAQVTFVLPGGGAASLDTGQLSREPWAQTRAEPARPAVVIGRLEMADLHTARFRVRDRHGAPFDVHDAADPDAAARLVGRLVAVSGILLTGTGTQHHRIERGHVRAQAGDPSPEPAQSNSLPLDINEEEWRRFLEGHAGDLR